MSVSQIGAFAIASDEDLVPTRYKDQANVDTWGIGHTHHAGAPDPRQMSFAMPANQDAVVREAWEVFLTDLTRYTAPVLAALGPVAQHELDGWVMWHFNTGGIGSTSAVKKWKAGDKAGAVRVLQSWNKVTKRGAKVVSDGLVKRRQREADIILLGRYPADATLDIFPTDGAGKIRWSAKTASYDYAGWKKFLGQKNVDIEAPARPDGVSRTSLAAVIIAAIAALGAGVASIFERFFQ